MEQKGRRGGMTELKRKMTELNLLEAGERNEIHMR